MDMIGKEVSFGWELRHVIYNYDVSIILRFIGIHQELKNSINNTNIIWVELLCHVQYLF